MFNVSRLGFKGFAVDMSWSLNTVQEVPVGPRTSLVDVLGCRVGP